MKAKNHQKLDFSELVKNTSDTKNDEGVIKKLENLNELYKSFLSLTTSKEVLIGAPRVLCALKQKESVKFIPFTKYLYFSEKITAPPKAPSKCIQISCFLQIGTSSSILSNAHSTVVPAVAFK